MLRFGYEHLAQNGFEKQALEIKNSEERDKTSTSRLVRAKIVNLLIHNKLLDDFIEKYSPYGKTDKGDEEEEEGSV